MALRLANTDSIKLPLSDGDWVEVKTDITRKDWKRVSSLMPKPRAGMEEDGLTAEESLQFQSALFGCVVTAWSADFPATVENYENLTSNEDATAELDLALAKHFESIKVTKDDAGKQ